jgi:Tfp pilus assembly protein PilP
MKKRDLVGQWLLADEPLTCDLPGDAELLAWIKETKRQARAEVAEMTAFQMSLDPEFYSLIATPDPDAVVIAAAAEMKLLTPDESKAAKTGSPDDLFKIVG